MLATQLYIGLILFLSGNITLNSFSKDDYLNPEKPLISSQNTEKSRTVLATDQMPGKEVYDDFCVQCHGANGKGDGINFPPLDGSDWLTKKRAKSIHAVKYGQTGEVVVNGKKFNNVMPPMGLSNKEIADVMNYIMNSWSNKKMKAVTEKEVESVAK